MKRYPWFLALVSCAAAGQQASSRAEPQPKAAVAPSASPSASASPSPSAVERPGKRLTIPEARRYMLALINRDRASQGLRPVELDEGPPTAAGQAHAEDMAHLGYLGHWGSDGSVPEQRHTQAGGADMVLENASCFVDEAVRTLDAAPTIDPAQIERAESQFFDEVPPNDGHRKNILKPAHTKVGIGIAQPVSTATEIAVPCFAQEFTDNYGTYAPVPKRAKVGAMLHVEGTLDPRAKPTGVGVARVPAPKPLTPAELNKRRSYPVPKPFQMYWAPGFVTPVPLKIDGSRFSIDVPLSDKGQPGLYEVSVWAKIDGATEHTMVGLRTIFVD
ncbi:MAG: CAP domain-containing protein [Labilithrix sp.]|nr:CAP domain-containing protein [Labilithrix sp.]